MPKSKKDTRLSVKQRNYSATDSTSYALLHEYNSVAIYFNVL